MAAKITSPKGFVEYLPKDQIKFDYLRNKIAETYASFGFYHIATPAVEYMKTLSGEGDISKEVYAIKRAKGEMTEGEEVSSENERGLRFDLTKPLARYTAEHFGDLTFPFKRYQIQPVWRGERPQKGRLREFYQADVDIIGNGDLSAGYDFEILDVIASTLDNLNIGQFVIKVNNRESLQAILICFGIPGERFGDALRIVDKLNKVGSQGVENSLVEEIGISRESAVNIVNLIDNKMEKEKYIALVETLSDSLVSAKFVFDYADFTSRIKYKNISFTLDLSIARGLDYYTGMVFETEFVGYESYGSVASGGRYENLASEFTNQKLPGVGGSIGLSRLFTLIQNEGIGLSDPDKKTTLYITYFQEAQRKKAQELAKDLRDQSMIVEVAPEVIKLDKALKYAINKEMDYLLILEEDGRITRKDLKTREQITLLSKDDLKF